MNTIGKSAARWQAAGGDMEGLIATVIQAADEFGPAGLRGAMSEVMEEVDKGLIPAVGSLDQILGDTTGTVESTWSASRTFRDVLREMKDAHRRLPRASRRHGRRARLDGRGARRVHDRGAAGSDRVQSHVGCADRPGRARHRGASPPLRRGGLVLPRRDPRRVHRCDRLRAAVGRVVAGDDREGRRLDPWRGRAARRHGPLGARVVRRVRDGR